MEPKIEIGIILSGDDNLVAHLTNIVDHVLHKSSAVYKGVENLTNLENEKYFLLLARRNYDLSVVLNDALELVHPITNELTTFTQEGGEIEINVSILVSGTMPSINFQPELLNILGVIGASIDIDIN